MHLICTMHLPKRKCKIKREQKYTKGDNHKQKNKTYRYVLSHMGHKHPLPFHDGPYVTWAM